LNPQIRQATQHGEALILLYLRAASNALDAPTWKSARRMRVRAQQALDLLAALGPAARGRNVDLTTGFVDLVDVHRLFNRTMIYTARLRV